MAADGLEVYTAKQFLYSQLTADSTLAALGVYDEEAPPSSSYPCIEFRYLSNTPQKGVGDVTVLTTQLWLVVAISESRTPPFSFQPLQGYVGRIFTQLDRQSATTANGQTLWSSFEQGFQRRFYDGSTGYEYREEGAQYRLWVQN